MRWLLALILALACSPAALANVAQAHVAACATANSSCTDAGTPANGNLVSVIISNTAAIGSVTVKDSNSVSLTEHQPSLNCVTGNVLCVAVFDYIVSGSPTATYTIAGTAGSVTCGGTIAEFSGATTAGAQYAANNATTVASAGALFTTITTLVAHDGEVGGANVVSQTGTMSTLFSNESTSSFTGGCSNAIFGLVATTGSGNFEEFSTGGTQTSAVVGFADYPSSAPPFSPSLNASGVTGYVRDRIFEQVVALL